MGAVELLRGAARNVGREAVFKRPSLTLSPSADSYWILLVQVVFMNGHTLLPKSATSAHILTSNSVGY